MCCGMGCPWENYDGECTKPVDMPCVEPEGEEEEEDLLSDDEDALIEYIKFLLKVSE